MDQSYNLNILASEMRETFKHELATSVLSKCTKSCISSL